MGSVGCPRGYALGELLGSGSYGSVFKARKTSGHRDVVAVKRVDKTKLSKSESDNLVNEIALLKRLKHDHIVQMVDFSWDAANIYIVMEFCAGGDLSKFIKARTRLDERVCLAFLRQLALALRYLRSENVAHLDLKPSNILLMTPPTRLKLADFGFAQKLEMGEERNSVRGSPLYMAPEMINDRSYTAKADLWSVGVILYECLFGKAPYKSANVQELLDKVRQGVAIVIPEEPRVSHECHDLLARCLERDVEKRIDYNAFFGHAFLDLEHAPTDPRSKIKADELAVEAKRFDEAGRYDEALEAYTKALEYFVPLIHAEANKARKRTLTDQVGHYLQRAEDLKRLLQPSTASAKNSPPIEVKFVERRLQQQSSRTKFQELCELAKMYPKMATGLEIAGAAEEYDLEGRSSLALDKFETAFSILLPLLGQEPSGRRKALLGEELKRWISRAETLKRREKAVVDFVGDSVSASQHCILS